MISQQKYADHQTGLPVSAEAKVNILSQELIKNNEGIINHMQGILDVQNGLSFRPDINESSRNLHRTINDLSLWSDQTEQKKKQMRD